MFLAFALASPALAGPPDRFATCEDQHVYFETQLRARPAERPTLWWIELHTPCPYGFDLVGAQPPHGTFVGCEDDHGRRYGWRTEFGGGGKVASQSHWDRNREIGPRLEWDPVTYEVIRQTSLREGRAEGETIEWLPDDGVLVVTMRRGERDGPTWRLDERGELMMVEWWRANQRHGRTCTWRSGLTAVNQVYADGTPATM